MRCFSRHDKPGPAAEDSIQKFLRGEDYAQTVGAWIDASSKKLDFPFTNIIPDWYLTKVNALGFEIKGADVDWSSQLEWKIVSLIKNYHRDAGNLAEYGPLMVGERSHGFMCNRESFD